LFKLNGPFSILVSCECLSQDDYILPFLLLTLAYLNPKTFNLNTNPYKVNSITATQYQFESVGSKGTIKKGVEISPLELPGYYNFGFGDANKDGSIDDEAETNNGDLLKVFSTIIKIMTDFLRTHPSSTLYFSGSTQQRTDVYNIILRRNYAEFSNLFDITAITKINNRNAEIEYDPHSTGKYLAFLIRKKNDNFVIN